MKTEIQGDLDCDELVDYSTKEGKRISSGRGLTDAFMAYIEYAIEKKLTTEETDLTLDLMVQAILVGEYVRSDKVAKRNSRRATNGRRLIGANSRAKVASAAESFRHLSKERAAAAIAQTVNLDPGTIRRYLSELFPGDKWKLKS